MNREISNALSGYIETLYYINQKLIKLYGFDPYINCLDNEREILDLVRELPRLIPYGYNKSEDIIELKPKNGLLEFASEIPYLQSDYEMILQKHYDFLNAMRLIRNKYEHIMHNVHFCASVGTPTAFSYSFYVERIDPNIDTSLSSTDLTNLIKDLNQLFDKIVDDIIIWARENEVTNYPYYQKLLRFKFEDFNTLYDDKNLNIIGKIMHNF